MWRSDEEKVRKLLDSISQESGRRKHRHLQRLKKIGHEHVSLLKDAVQVTLGAVLDEEENVRKEAYDILEIIVSEKPEYLRKGLGTLAPHIRMEGARRKRVLKALRFLASEDISLVEDFKPLLMREVLRGDEKETALIIQILEKMGVAAKEYAKRLRSIRNVLKDAKNSGADIEQAERMLEEAQNLMIKKGIDEFLMRTKKAELMARYAKKVAVKWRDILNDIDRVSISTTGRKIVVSRENEVLLYTDDKEIDWRVTLEGRVTLLRFLPKDGGVLVGTSERRLYLLSSKGDVIWKKSKGGEITDADMADQTRELFICSGDSNISIHNSDGVEKNKEWTEKPAKRLRVTSDGKTIMMIFGDHNIFSYDRRLFQQWKYMGGIWNDIDISEDGAFILGGSQGGDAVCLSSSGTPIWTKTFDGPIERVAIREDPDCFLVATSDEILCYSRSGKSLWRYKSREPIVDFDVSWEADLLAIATEKGLYMVENREVYRRFLKNLGPSLKTMEDFGIDMVGVNELIMKADEAFSKNDYTEGSKIVSEIKKRVEDTKLERGTELLVLAEKKLSDAKEHGIDVTEGESILHRAENLINKGEYHTAILEAKHALKSAKKAESMKKRTEMAEEEKRKKEVRKIIDVAVSMIDDAESMGIDTTEAEEGLQAAITALDENEFDQCIFLVKELDDLIRERKKTLAGRTEANFARAVGVLEREDSTPEDISLSIDNLLRAVKYYESKQSITRVAKCYEILAKLENKNENQPMSRNFFQKAINTYFKLGELEQVAKLIMSMMKELEEEEDLPAYDIEDAFLIFKDGRLIAHQTMRLRPEMDRQILGGMLVAIQNFVEDSLMTTGEDMLNELRYGNTKILIQRGDYITVAVVISGTESKALWQRITKAIEDMESRYGKRLSKWDGDLDKLWGVKKLFEQYVSQF